MQVMVAWLAVAALGGDRFEGFAGPANRWTARGGGPTHSGATLTRPVRGPVEVAWTHDAGGEIESEPLVWDDLVVLAIKTGKDERVLRALDLTTGARTATDRRLRTTSTLEPSLWRNVVAFRGAPDQVMAMRVYSTRMTEVWNYRGATELGPPLLVGRNLYLAGSGGLRKFAVGHRTPTWTLNGDFRGELALGPEGLRGVFAAEAQAESLADVDPERGVHRYEAMPWPAPSLEGSPRAVLTALMPSGAFVRTAAPVVSTGGDRIDVVRVGSPKFGDAMPQGTALTSLPAFFGPGWIARGKDEVGDPLLLCSESPSEPELRVLANKDIASQLVGEDVGVSVAGAVAYIGPLACDFASRRILWRAPGVRPTQRPVVARETVLYVDGGRKLVAMRNATRRAPNLESDSAAAQIAGVLVLRDGSIEHGELSIDPQGRRVSRAGKNAAESWSFDELLLVEDTQQRILWWTDAVRGLTILADEAQTAAGLEIARDARRANDPDLLQSSIDVAIELGAPEKELDPLLKILEAQRKSRTQPIADVVERVRQARDRLARVHTEEFWRRVQALPDARRERLDTTLLREVLERDPAHSAAREYVRALVPQALRPAGDFDVRDALDLVESLRRTPVAFVAAPEAGAKDVSADQIEIGKRAPFWRGDLIGVRSENLLIVTGARGHGRLARFLALGAGVCDALEGFFPGGTVSREDRRPMVIELFENRAEYLASASDPFERAMLESSAGHYDMIANVSRFYLPDGAHEVESSLSTAAHELTHHWLRMRCPAWPFRSLSGHPGDMRMPGFWVVEGFASFVGEFGFDPQDGSWSLGGSSSALLDVVANAAEGQLLPWSKVFDASHVSAPELWEGSPVLIPSSVYLGGARTVDRMMLFYAQSMATVRYLYESKDGALRSKLFDFLRAYYSGDAAHVNLSQQLGVSADELGRAITACARGIVGTTR